MKKLGNELTLIQLMTDGNDYTAEDLCNHLGCTRRNLYYYLQFLREYGFGVLRNENYYSLDVNSPFFSNLASSVNFTLQEAVLIHNLADSAEQKNPAVLSVKKKLERYYDLRFFSDSKYKKKQLRNLKDISDAIAAKRIVCLKEYSSPHSHSFTDRVVEPFLLFNDNQDVRCYELESGKNKTFKLSRITNVEVYDAPWIHASEHRKVFTDVFSFSGEELYPIKLLVGQLSYNLMMEEFPISSALFSQKDKNHWIVSLDVVSYLGIGRFVLGLYDDIEILEGDGFKDYIKSKIVKMIQ